MEYKHNTTFNNIKKQIYNIVKNKKFDVDKETRVKSDASKLGPGACLEQKPAKFSTIAFSSRLLNPEEERYSTNELELVTVVWSLEH